MALERAEPTIRIGFLGDEGTDQVRQVSANALATILSNFQRAVYVTVAERLNLPHTRNLTAEQRRQYALAVTGIEYGSIHVFLTPETLTLGLQAYSVVLQTIDFIRNATQGRNETDSQMEAIVRAIIETSEGTHKDIEFYGRSPDGTEAWLRITEPVRQHYFDTDRASEGFTVSDEALEAEYGEPVSFGRAVIRDILTTQPIITPLRASAV
jgi:hypothetical protein